MPSRKKEKQYNPLVDFIKDEIPFRLRGVLELPEGKITDDFVRACVTERYDSPNTMFDYDVIDSLLIGVCDDYEQEEITTVCYGNEQKWENRRKAKGFFIDAMSCSEGSELERYANVLIKLERGLTYCTDKEDDNE